MIEITSCISGEIPATIQLLNLAGQLVFTLWKNEILYSGQPFRFNLNENNVIPGIYFLTSFTQGRKIAQNVVFQ